MDALIRMLAVWAICLVPVAIAVTVIRRQRLARLNSKEAPFPDLKRRPAGEALRLKLAELDEQIMQYVSLLVGLPVLVALTAWFNPRWQWFTFIPMILFCAGWTWVFGVKLSQAQRDRENYSLGYDGERFVGEELSRLIAARYEIYHDVPFDGFNIDHVLVGPGGVFSIETKTRRKPVTDSGKEYRVTFDGSCLRWPWGPDAYGLIQAQNNAESLSQWLSSAVGDPVHVTPILTLPGWLVDRLVPTSRVLVFNPKEIGSAIRRSEEKLSENTIRRICHQLDQKCKLAVE